MGSSIAISEVQQRAYDKITDEPITSYELGERRDTLKALQERGFIKSDYKRIDGKLTRVYWK